MESASGQRGEGEGARPARLIKKTSLTLQAFRSRTLGNFSTVSHTYVHVQRLRQVTPFYAFPTVWQTSFLRVAPKRTFSGLSWWRRLTADTRTIILPCGERVTVWPEFGDTIFKSIVTLSVPAVSCLGDFSARDSGNLPISTTIVILLLRMFLQVR